MHSRFYRTAQFVFSFFKFSNKWFDEIQKINDGNRLKQFTFSFMKENFNQNYIIYHQETEIWYGNLCNNRKIVAEPLLYARGRIALWVVTVLARPFKNLIRSCGTLSGRNYNDQIKSWSELIITFSHFHNASNNDDQQSHNLTYSEDILNSGSPFDAPSIHYR